MIELIEGKGVGAGKSYFAVDRLMTQWLRGGTAFVSDTVEILWENCKAYAKKNHGLVLEDDQCRVITSETLQNLHEVTAAGSAELPVLIVVDESQDAFNARDWSDKGMRPFFSWLCQSRHDDNDVLMLSQAIANVDKQVRRLATFIYVVRNSENFPVGGIPLSRLLSMFFLGLWDGKCFIRTQLDQDGHTALGRRWIRADRGLFKCYNSKAMRLKHRRLAEVIARKKLAKVKGSGWLGMLKYVIPTVLVCSVVAGWHMLHSSLVPKAEVGRGPLVSVAKDGAMVQRPLVNGQVVQETLMASSQGYLQTVEHGIFRAGFENELGFCLAVTEESALVEVRPGVRVQVRAPMRVGFRVLAGGVKLAAGR